MYSACDPCGFRKGTKVRSDVACGEEAAQTTQPQSRKGRHTIAPDVSPGVSQEKGTESRRDGINYQIPKRPSRVPHFSRPLREVGILTSCPPVDSALK